MEITMRMNIDSTGYYDVEPSLGPRALVKDFDEKIRVIKTVLDCDGRMHMNKLQRKLRRRGVGFQLSFHDILVTLRARGVVRYSAQSHMVWR
jgi:hypothetical protein